MQKIKHEKKDNNKHALSTSTQAIPSELRLSEKFKEWARLFMDKSNKEYWGNATKCALKAYDTDNYKSATVIGHENLVKLRKVAALIMEEEDLGFGELMKIGAAKMLKGSYSDWEEFMRLLGYFGPKNKMGVEVENTFNFENLNVAIIRDRKARGLEC